MFKILNFIGSLWLSVSPVLALNIISSSKKSYLLFQKKSRPNIDNNIVTYHSSENHLQWTIMLSSSTYNGFPGYMSQILAQRTFSNLDYGYAIFFFQWLNDNRFGSYYFPDLSKWTQHGFYHWPFLEDNSLQSHIGTFREKFTYTQIAFQMIFNISNYFMECAEHDYTVARGKVGISFSFNFGYENNSYVDYGHSYKILY